MSQILKRDVRGKIVSLGHFAWYHNTMGYDQEGERNVEIIEKLLNRTIDPDDLISLLNGKRIEHDTVDYPHMWEAGREYEVYEFKVNGKKYYAVKDCGWGSDWWACTVDIYNNYRDVKKAIKRFYEDIVDEIEDVKPNIVDDEIYEELEDLEAYAWRQIKSLK